MKNVSHITSVVVMLFVGFFLCSCFVLSCNDIGSPASVKELQEGQKQILERLKKIEDLLSKQRQMRPPIDYNKVYDIPLGNSPWRGAKDAKVTLVEFSDYQCPFSKQTQPIIKQILEAFPKDVRHVYKNYPLPFHQKALPAAKAGLAAQEQGKFWEMHDLIFEDQKKMEESDLLGYANKLGLNQKRFEEDYKGEKLQKQIDADLQDVRTAEVTGTPTLFLNGKRVQDRSFEGMKQAIEKIMSEKEAKPTS